MGIPVFDLGTITPFLSLSGQLISISFEAADRVADGESSTAVVAVKLVIKIIILQFNCQPHNAPKAKTRFEQTSTSIWSWMWVPIISGPRLKPPFPQFPSNQVICGCLMQSLGHWRWFLALRSAICNPCALRFWPLVIYRIWIESL